MQLKVYTAKVLEPVDEMIEARGTMNVNTNKAIGLGEELRYEGLYELVDARVVHNHNSSLAMAGVNRTIVDKPIQPGENFNEENEPESICYLKNCTDDSEHYGLVLSMIVIISRRK